MYSPSDDASPFERAGERPAVFGVPEGLANHPRYHILELLGKGGTAHALRAGWWREVSDQVRVREKRRLRRFNGQSACHSQVNELILNGNIPV